MFQSALRFAVLPDLAVWVEVRERLVSIRFKVRGASRPQVGNLAVYETQVSIRFKVRGASRHLDALRVAEAKLAVSIRFKVRGASRLAVQADCHPA